MTGESADSRVDGRRSAGRGNVTGVDAYAPAEVAGRVEAAGVVKAALPVDKLLVLAILAGAFIGFGAAFYTVAVSDAGLGFGPTRLLGGLAFSLGLVLVIVAGANSSPATP
jgi:formate/nitrite transporter FocA (FNT family)